MPFPAISEVVLHPVFCSGMEANTAEDSEQSLFHDIIFFLQVISLVRLGANY